MNGNHFIYSSEVEMEVDHFSNGVSESSSNGFLNGSTHGVEPEDCDAEMGESSHIAMCTSLKAFLPGSCMAKITYLKHIWFFGYEIGQM